MEKLLRQAVRLREEGKLAQSKEMLVGLARFTQHPEVYYQCAWVHDTMGLETEAVPYYERAIELGLEGESLHGAYIGLGSTYRFIGEYDKAIATLQAGLHLYPDDDVMKVFLAMAKYNTNKHEDAMKLLIDLAVKLENVEVFKKPILFYKDHLNETFK